MTVAGAADLTPQQMLEQLSPAEKEALAKKYGVELPGEKGGAVTVNNPPVVKARPLENSEIEGEFKAPAAADEKLTLAKPVAVDSPVTKISGQAAAEALELRRGFADFVAESKALKVDTNLRQFGYELFAGTPSTFAPVTDVPVPAEYVLGPGDELKVQLFGKTNQQLAMIVDREGVIAFPEIGPLNVAGMSFAQARAYIAEQVKEKTIGVSVSITMGELRSIRVFALGEVSQPGSYLVSGLATLSQALFVSGGVKKIGSLRKIQLKRDGQLVTTIDLYDFLLKGDTSADVRLLPGDVVFVPPVGATVGVAGEVMRPAIYELRTEKSLGDLLTLAGGLRPTAFREKALIERVGENGIRSVQEVALQDAGLQTTLRNHDLIKIFSILDYEKNPVFLVGNVKRPSKYAWKEGMRLSSLVSGPDQLMPETYLDYALIEREAADNREPELVRFSLADLLNGKAEADLLLQPRDKVYIFHRSHFRQAPMVTISGQVQSPGSYELKRSMRLVDLLLSSGGLRKTADPSEAELYRTDPVSKEVSLSRYSLAAALAGVNDQNPLLQDSDRLVVHSIWETKQRFTVRALGEVNNPGSYELAAGMRVADLVFAAGNLTPRAYLKQAEITHFDIVNGEERVTRHESFDLTAALQGDAEANQLLAPYDVITVRTLSNWRGAESVTLAGEFKFPGTYPIEEGERLSSVIKRAGGFLPEAYLDAAFFTRESIRQDQQQQIDEMVRRLEREINLTQASIGRENPQSLALQRNQTELVAAQKILEAAKRVKATGRLVIQLSDVKALANSEFDLALRDGDVLRVPKRPEEVHIIGQVYNSSSQLYRPGDDRDDYIQRSGGLTNFADKGSIYVVRANGEVDPQKGWWRSREIHPGDVIVVPEKLDRFYAIESALDWSKVLMQVGVGVASMKTLGIL
ncbi:SLBB domain-containing protein [Desulfuromonas carbonis]|nr:periplasmic polysaccharide biosynthesis/export protein [Desulfuromonas sp. DDH964]